MIRGNDKNKQITLPTQTCINWKKYVNSSVNSEGRDAFSGLYCTVYTVQYIHLCHQCVKLSVLSRVTTFPSKEVTKIASLSVFMLKWWMYKDIDSNRSQIV